MSIGKPYGQKEDLVNRINDILKRYAGKFTVFKEMIQNAEDAGATEIAFILDTRELGTKKTFGNEFNVLQGPALLCWNDSIFSEWDIEGITSLGIGSKREATEKIGRFGVGFNSVYHITDAPQFISGLSNYAIFDPLCKHWKVIDKSEPGRILSKKEIEENFITDKFGRKPRYSDVLEGFQVPGFDLKKGTMFRLALRSVQPGSSEKNQKFESSSQTPEEIRNLMLEFSQENEYNYVFFKNLRKVSFYEYSGKVLESIDQKSIRIHFLNVLDSQKRDTIRRLKVGNQINTAQLENLVYVVFVENKKLNSSKEFVVWEQIGFDTSIDGVNDLIESLKKKPDDIGKHFPYAGIALESEYFTKSSSSKKKTKLFCYLPLDQESPLEVHMNAYWALHQENRRGIYEFSMRTENKETELAKWCTNWNLSIIKGIILPLFIKMIAMVKQKQKIFQPDIKQFMGKYFQLFPKYSEISQDLKPYFEGMFKIFYKTIYNLDMFPIWRSNESSITWLEPSNVLFYSNLNADRTQENVILKVVNKMKLNVCSHLELYYSFKRAKVEPQEFEARHLIKSLEDHSKKIIGKRVDTTFLENVETVKAILDFIRYESNNNKSAYILLSTPLIVTENSIVQSFNHHRSVIIYKHVDHFKGHENMFLHRELYLTIQNFNDYNQFLRPITIEDLDILLPCQLEPKRYKNSKSEYIEYDEFDENAYKLVWKIIADYFKTLDLKNPSANDYRKLLKPIKNWSLIPVEYQNKSCLVPVKNANLVLVPNYTGLYFRNIGFPVLKQAYGFPDVFKNAVVDLKNNEELLVFLGSHSEIEKIFSNNQYSRGLLRHMSTLAYINENKIVSFRLGDNSRLSKMEIQKLLRRLPIFENIFEQKFEKLIYKTEAYFIDNVVFKDHYCAYSKESLLKADFIDYLNHHETMILMKCDDSLKLLFEFLDVTKLEIEDLYEMFFKWVSDEDDHDKLKILKDHVLYLIKNYDVSERFTSILKNLKFIMIGDDFYRADECYHHSNELFKFLDPSRVLPKEFRTNQWIKHLISIGLRTECEPDDCIRVAEALKSSQIDNKTRVLVCEALLKRIIHLNDNQLINKIKYIKFIQSAFSCSQNEETNLLKKIYNPPDELVCFSGSCFEDLIAVTWIQKPILPGFCRHFIDQNLSKQFEIEQQPDAATVLENFKDMVNFLQSHPNTNDSNLLNSLSSGELTSLNNIILNHYEWFFIHQSSIDSNQLDIFKECDLILICDVGYKFVKPTQIVRNLELSNQISGFFYKMPTDLRLDDFWSFFKQLGFRNELEYEDCARILKTYHDQFGTNKLPEDIYSNVLVVIKLLLYENLISKEPRSTELYFPNILLQMRPLNSLFYHDKPDLRSRVRNSAQLDEVSLFDVEDLIAAIKNSMDKNSSNCGSIKDLMISQISWEKIFESIRLENRPSPFSAILIEKIKRNTPFVIDNEKTNNLTSSIATKIWNLIEKYDQEFDSLKPGDKIKVQNVVTKFRIYSTANQTIVTFIHRKGCGCFPQSKMEKSLVCLSDEEDETIKFYVTSSQKESFEFYYNLGGAIVEELERQLLDAVMLRQDGKEKRRFFVELLEILKPESKNREIQTKKCEIN